MGIVASASRRRSSGVGGTGLPVGDIPLDRPRFSMAYARLGVVQSVELDQRRLQMRWTGTGYYTDRSRDPDEDSDLFRSMLAMIED